MAERAFDPGALDYLVHGATIAINTVIQRNGASLGLLVTAGFGDVLEIQRLRLASPVNFTATRPLPLIPRYRVGEVTERILTDGTVDTALDRDELLREATRLVEREGAEALVVSFVNAYRTPAHEAEARKVLAERFPGLHVTCSHEVWPQIREYERTMVAILSAYVRPRVDRYLAQLERELGGVGVRVPLYITKSNGGVTTARDARQATAETMLSGPASGVIGATHVCVRAGYRDLITFDMGGTSADIALVRDGQPVYSTSETVGDFPIVMPVVGVSSIGAGGGSIAWLDPVGVLKVGPRSAGADPGPACYGHGGTEPALSDAFLLCGFLNPDNFVGGRLRLHPDRAALAMRPLGEALGLDVHETAEAVIEVATANMYAAFSNVLARHGLDPRDFALVAFGGAGPVEACFLAEEFHIPRVIVPPSPGTLCAQGAMMADVKSDYVEDDSPEAVRDLWPAARRRVRGAVRARDALARPRRRPPSRRARSSTPRTFATWGRPSRSRCRSIPRGSTSPAPTACGPRSTIGTSACTPTPTAPPTSSSSIYAQPSPATLRSRRSGLSRWDRAPATPAGRRPIHYRKQRHDAAVYHRRDLLAGQHLDGPAVIEQEDTTTLVPAGFRASVDAFGNLVIERA